MSHRRKKNPITLDATRLFKQAVIGCTVLPSRDDPNLANGVALTTLNAYDENYVKFEDIDGMGEPSYRYWKDVYLICAWNDKNYKHKPLKVGDKIFALFQNIDNTFTTVYYNAKIVQLPNIKNHKMVIDFLDDTGSFKNIHMILHTTIQTKDGKITVPTIIRRICAQNTKVHQNAMGKYKKTKTNKHKIKIKNKNKNMNRDHTYRDQSVGSNVSVSDSLTPLKKSTKKSNKKQVKSESDNSDSAITCIVNSKHSKHSKHNSNNNNSNINMNIGVVTNTKNNKKNKNNTRKRKYEQINNNNNNMIQPPLKRQRSSRKKQKLKKPIISNKTNGTNKVLKINKTNVINKVNASHKTNKNISNSGKTIGNETTQKAKGNKKTFIKIKRKSKKKEIKIGINKKAVKLLSQPNPTHPVITVPTIQLQSTAQSLVQPPVPQPRHVPTRPPIRPPIMRPPIQPQPQPQPHPQVNQRRKFKKMWGNYEVGMPILPNGFKLFDEKDLYLHQLLISDKNKTKNENNKNNKITNEYFISTQEIGEITVAPYVIDIDMFNVLS